FTRQAVILIHERSAGIARTISVMCDNALLGGFGLGRQPVDYDMVLEVARDFDLGGRDTRVADFGSEATRQDPPAAWQNPLPEAPLTETPMAETPMAETPMAETPADDERTLFAVPRRPT